MCWSPIYGCEKLVFQGICWLPAIKKLIENFRLKHWLKCPNKFELALSQYLLQLSGFNCMCCARAHIASLCSLSAELHLDCEKKFKLWTTITSNAYSHGRMQNFVEGLRAVNSGVVKNFQMRRALRTKTIILKESGIFLAWCNLLRHYVSGFQYAIMQFCASRLIQVQVR